MATKHFHCPLSLKDVGENGFFKGYASVFHELDSHKDIILPGAFTKSLKDKKRGKEVKLLWQHHTDEPIGSFSRIEEDSKGLYVEGTLALDVRRGKEAYTLLKTGALSGLSIGYTAKASHFDPKTGYRYLTEVDLWEVSMVTFPANPKASITQVKNQISDANALQEYHMLAMAINRAISILQM